MGKGGSVDRVVVPKDEGTRPVNNVKQEQTHLAKLAAKHPDKRFGKLYRLICQPEWLMKALDAVVLQKGRCYGKLGLISRTTTEEFAS
jgi:hypothetical protein